MKKIVGLICVTALMLCLFGCDSSQTNIQNDFEQTTQNDNNTVESNQELEEIVLQEPPILSVTHNETTIDTLNGTSSWTYQKEDGTTEGICSDSLHPLQAKEHMPLLSLIPTQYSHKNTNTAYLQFKVIPDEVTVRCWSEKYWGQLDAESEEVPVKMFMIDSNVETQPIISIELKDGNYIYEVFAKWNSSEKYSGTALYSFYTFKPYIETTNGTAENKVSNNTQTEELCSYPLAPQE